MLMAFRDRHSCSCLVPGLQRFPQLHQMSRGQQHNSCCAATAWLQRPGLLCVLAGCLPSGGAAHVKAACFTTCSRLALRHGGEKNPLLQGGTRHGAFIVPAAPGLASRAEQAATFSGETLAGSFKRQLDPPTDLLLLLLCDAQAARAAVVESVPLQLDRLVHDQAQVSCSSRV